jgi:hypothetical protein
MRGNVQASILFGVDLNLDRSFCSLDFVGGSEGERVVRRVEVILTRMSPAIHALWR